MQADAKPQRRPFQGSCHCGAVRYTVYLTVPRPPHAESPAADRVYRCNCTICHKSGFMHVRPPVPADDFALLSPAIADLGDYRSCNAGALRFFFCRVCGVRCFIFAGEGHVVEAQSGDLGLAGPVEVWRPTGPGAGSNAKLTGCYLSVNGHTIDAGQDGFDMRDWVERESVMYYDFLKDEEPGPGRYGKPYPGGCY
ncbi:Mss4-like protein [Cordyceps fumosorosea ARSEF 2679]|uniref:Mss4-like protein n=1 Tax=Cordyceps fumosorosea (strain ARSEF 2679) TaxID=1081104 RepID=A0A167S9R6_CORFA|nr:Mss4-like protein [Cordyceps fumosorosea ARSEF 2679]OAA59404.1 Mss4-like protein [Cordyceps fumosorosea ARSEF 2679]